MNGVSLLDRSRPARAERAEAPAELRYWAYLSYSHRDEADAKWLHRAIEHYRVPPAMVGKPSAQGPIPASLAPVFRDRQELAASNDLGGGIREALSQSRFLIVLCSPAAAASHWTNEEIAAFKRLRPDGGILAAIVGGEPHASAIPGREGEECFPPALRVQYDKRGRATAKRAEPIAADLREGRDGRRMGLLKVVAGMLRVGLDDLVRREAQRKSKRLQAMVAASLAGMTVTSGLALAAVYARDEARDQRREAEGLVGFMLGDLRDKLQPLGRLDVLDAVGGRARGYYEKQAKGALSDEAMAQRSRALTLMGEIANTRGDLEGALRRYREALAGTGEALRRKPGDAQALFDHAQNIFWVGYIDWQRGETEAAARAFREYKLLANRMAAAAPDDPKYRLEGVYADSNLGTVLLDQRHYAAAARVFEQALGAGEALAAADPRNADYQKLMAEALANLSSALERSGKIEEALTQRERQIALIDRQMKGSGDVEYRSKAMAAHRAMGRLFASRGEMGAALDHARTASRLAEDLIRIEPANTQWLEFGAGAQLELGQLLTLYSEPAAAGAAIRSGCDMATRLIAKDRSVVAWSGRLQRECLTERARLALASGAPGEAVGLGQAALATIDSKALRRDYDEQYEAAVARRLIGDAYRAAGDEGAAKRAWRAALGAWPAGVGQSPHQLAERAILLTRTGDSGAAAQVAGQLGAIGYRHPAYLKAINPGGTR
jgi:tetratricopeptide (TPR) repeat protein